MIICDKHGKAKRSHTNKYSNQKTNTQLTFV